MYSSSRGTVHDDSRWLVMTPKISTEILNFCRHPWVKICRFLRQYLTYGGHIGLYVCLQDTADATRTFLSRITPSRVVFRVILVPRDPWDNSEVTVRARSFVTTHLTETVFRHRMTWKTLANGRIQCRRRKSSPRTSKSDKNWSLWTEKCPWVWCGHFLLCDFEFFRFPPGDLWLNMKIFSVFNRHQMFVRLFLGDRNV